MSSPPHADKLNGFFVMAAELYPTACSRSVAVPCPSSIGSITRYDSPRMAQVSPTSGKAGNCAKRTLTTGW